MIESLSIAVHAFVSRVSMSFSVDEIYFYSNSIENPSANAGVKNSKRREEEEILFLLVDM